MAETDAALIALLKPGERLSCKEFIVRAHRAGTPGLVHDRLQEQLWRLSRTGCLDLHCAQGEPRDPWVAKFSLPLRACPQTVPFDDFCRIVRAEFQPRAWYTVAEASRVLQRVGWLWRITDNLSKIRRRLNRMSDEGLLLRTSERPRRYRLPPA